MNAARHGLSAGAGPCLPDRQAHRWSRALTAGAAALVAVACLSGEARALDVVRLRNGRSLEGKVTTETKKYVMLEVENGVLRIERTDILMVERDKPLAEWEIRMRQRARREAAALAKAAIAELEASQEEAEAAPSEADKRLTERLKRLVEDLGAEGPETRASARRAIEGEGRKAVPALTEALFHKSTVARAAAAEMLGRLGARESVRDMLVALRSAVPDSRRVRPWQRSFVKALRDCLRRVTGQSFGLNARAADQGEAVAKWIEWWEEKPAEPGAVPQGAYARWETPQLGEEELDEEDPEYAKKLWDARRVGALRHSYRPPPNYGGAGGEGEE